MYLYWSCIGIQATSKQGEVDYKEREQEGKKQ